MFYVLYIVNVLSILFNKDRDRGIDKIATYTTNIYGGDLSGHYRSQELGQVPKT